MKIHPLFEAVFNALLGVGMPVPGYEEWREAGKPICEEATAKPLPVVEEEPDAPRGVSTEKPYPKDDVERLVEEARTMLRGEAWRWQLLGYWFTSDGLFARLANTLEETAPLLAAKDARIRELEAASKNKDYCIRTADERLAEKSKYISGLEESLRRAREQNAELEAKLEQSERDGKDWVHFGKKTCDSSWNAALEEAAKKVWPFGQANVDDSAEAALVAAAAAIRMMKKP